MSNSKLRIPYTQQFSPEQTPLDKLLTILKECQDRPAELKEKVAQAFFASKTDPIKLSGNTLISLRNHGIINTENGLTDFGSELINFIDDLVFAKKILAKNILINLDGVHLIETIREMNAAGITIKLTTLSDELETRGVSASRNSSDLSSVLMWLKEAGIIDHQYNINTDAYEEIVGVKSDFLIALKELTAPQIAFLKAAVALNINDWTPYNVICAYAEQLFWGEIKYNWKSIVLEILRPLETSGYIEVRKKGKKDTNAPEGRGGKVTDIRPKRKFINDVEEPILSSLYKAAGLADLRKIRSLPLSDIIADIKQRHDTHKRGIALELLTIRICQLLNLEFDTWRETDENLTAGGEIDAMLHSSRLIYSRWQVQCKATDISLEAVAKEVGMNAVTLANVILIVGTGRASESALKYRSRIVASSNLNIIILEGKHLDEIVQDSSSLVKLLNKQAADAMRIKPNAIEGTHTPKYNSAVITDDTIISEDNIPDFQPSYSTDKGSMYCGDSLEVLPSLIKNGTKVKLIMTSPPFALIKKKEYGNMDSDEYIDWFMNFVPYFKQRT